VSTGASDPDGHRGSDRVAPGVERTPYGRTPDGTHVDGFTVRAGRITMRAIGYGATITELHTPDRAGQSADIVLGHDSLQGYLDHSPYFGAVVGRYANRIARGRFTLDGTEHVLDTNNGVNHLHGGICGFDRVVWDAEPLARDGEAGIVFTHTSADGDQHYPGELSARVTYTLTERGELVVDYLATTNAPTIVNLTQHSYFNLRGADGRDVLGHEVSIFADHYTPVDETLIPTGELAPVERTPFDFRHARPIGAHIGADDDQLRHAGGYDHNFVLRAGHTPDDRRHAARVTERESGRTIDVHTTEPGMQFYSGNFLDGSVTGKGGYTYAHRSGFCLETQHFPDSPNQSGFPSVVLWPGEEYRSSTTYTFGVDE
jgi:aldose 1-epimerase